MLLAQYFQTLLKQITNTHTLEGGILHEVLFALTFSFRFHKDLIFHEFSELGCTFSDIGYLKIDFFRAFVSIYICVST